MTDSSNPTTERLVFAADLGGTHLRVALVDDTGRILEQLKQETPKGDSAELIVDALANAAKKWHSDQLTGCRRLNDGAGRGRLR